ncbi:MAG TPA: flagellar motor protein MotB [Polyangiales bacterium]|nr:flagellar motor protein MotB [Polyangiales bacterium]
MSGQGGTKVIIIKKKAKHAGHHGGAWKVAYADFVTAMMALFIVLWLLTQTDESAKAAIAQYFRTGTLPGGTLMLGTPAGSNPPVPINIFEAGSQGGPSADPGLDALSRNIRKLLKDAANVPELSGLVQHIKLTETPEGTMIELIDGSDNFLFPVGSGTLKPGAVQFLSKLAPLLGKLKNRLEIHGHTDSRPFDKGAKSSNWDLSFLRANEARRVLEQNGVPLGRIATVEAHADSQLFNKEDPYSAENRRLAILIRRPKRKPVAPQPPHDDGAAAPSREPEVGPTEPSGAEPAPAPQP